MANDTGYQVVANAVVTALSEDGVLQEPVKLQRGDANVFSGEFYTSDLPTRLPSDGVRLLRRLRTCKINGQSIAVERPSSFTRYDDHATRYTHFFKIQPHNLLLKVEGYLNNLDWESQSPTPLFGDLSFFSTPRQLHSAYRLEVMTSYKASEQFALNHMKTLLRQFDGVERASKLDAFVRRLNRLAPR